MTNGIPIYLMIGDEFTVGTISAVYGTELDSPGLPEDERDTTQRIYDAGDATVEQYAATLNSNTSGTSAATAGPEFATLAELAVVHSTTGAILVKRGSNTSSLAASYAAYVSGTGGRWAKTHAATEHYNQLVTIYDATVSYANTTLSLQADVRGVFVSLGGNDQAVAGGGALFSPALSVFVSDLRADFATRTSGTLPIVWRRPQADAANAIPAEATIVRAAIDDYALTDSKFAVVDVDDLERLTADDLNETPEAVIAHGRRLADAMATIAI